MIPVSDYIADVNDFVRQNKSLIHAFADKSFLITGAGGLIGSYLIDLFIQSCREYGIKVNVKACDRDADLLRRRFPEQYNDIVSCLPIDICREAIPDATIDFIIHAASNTSPVDYAKRPVDTILTNVKGTDALCQYAMRNNVKRLLLCSSVEAYGRNNGDVDFFREDYSGYVDSNTVRSNYPSAKRCAESLCNAYAAENKNFDFVIARIGRFYGPTVLQSDSKAPTQFIRNAVDEEDIVLKSEGNQLYSWGYVGDCATALLTLLLKGLKGNAYNVADSNSCRTLREFASLASKEGSGKLKFVEQSSVERMSYSTVTKATLDTSKIEGLGWTAMRNLETGIPRTVKILRKYWRNENV